ncbi:hypothetical protein [Bradyrhizobium sp. ARR65]|uniref:hypothetical protein n=1 Tax=Bradyrhizobium sp. ARR65 TaxID=1040989 RepID=UPI001FD97D53|nr:hypothetical protein [Bradyrhizobium sp. ARR65]
MRQMESAASQEAANGERRIVTAAALARLRLLRPVAREQAKRGQQLGAPDQLIALNLSRISVLLPFDRLAALMDRTGKDGLRALVATADTDLQHHGLADRVFELQRSLIDLRSERRGVQAMAIALRGATEDRVGSRQHGRRHDDRLRAVEVNVGEPARLQTELHTDVLGLFAEEPMDLASGNNAMLPIVADRLFLPVRNRHRDPVTHAVLKCSRLRRSGLRPILPRLADRGAVHGFGRADRGRKVLEVLCNGVVLCGIEHE